MIGLVGESSLVGKHIKHDYSFRWRYSIDQKSLVNDVRSLGTNSLVVTAGFSDAQSYSKLNYEAEITFYKKIVRALSTLKHPHFMFASTSHVYGAIGSNNIVSENQPPKPITEYGKYKLQIEEELSSLAQHLGVSLTCFRIFSIFELGMKEHFLAGRIEREILNNGIIKIYNSDDVRDFCTSKYIGSLVSNLSKKVDIDFYPLPPVLNIGTGKGSKIKDKVREYFPNYARFSFIPGNSRIPFLVSDTELLLKILG